MDLNLEGLISTLQWVVFTVNLTYKATLITSLQQGFQVRVTHSA